MNKTWYVYIPLLVLFVGLFVFRDLVVTQQTNVASTKVVEQQAKSITKYLNDIYTDVYVDQEYNSNNILNKDYIVIEEIEVDDCGPNPDGPCGFPYYILGPIDWAWAGKNDKQEFYLATVGGAYPSSAQVYEFEEKEIRFSDVYGPFNDYVKQIVQEMRTLKTVTISPRE